MHENQMLKPPKATRFTGEMVGKKGKPHATVIIPTYNGEKYLRQILEAIQNQETKWDFEVLIIDSGSSDSTLEIIKDFEKVSLRQIPNHEFGHGKTRNLAAKLARGKYLAYLSHDAIPAHPHWLNEMISPLENDGVVAVMGKQVARESCFPLLKYEIRTVFRRFGPDFGLTIFSQNQDGSDEDELEAKSFYSDVNSATIRDFLLNTIPYQDIPYSEDMAFGKDVILAGYKKAYAPAGLVIHSNDLTLKEYRLRIFDEILSLRRLGKDLLPLRFSRQLIYPLWGAAVDTLRILKDREYSAIQKIKWLFVNPIFHFEKWRAFYVATHVDPEVASKDKKFSLEKTRLESK